MYAPAQGIYPNVPLAEYLSWPLPSKSWLFEARRSLGHLKAYLESRESTEPMEYGSLAHCAILEPDELERRYVVVPKFGTKKETGVTIEDARAAWKDECKRNGKETVHSEDLASAKNLAIAVRENPLVHEILAGSQTELSWVWKEPSSGVLCKGRLDAWNPALNVIVEVKTCRSCEDWSFAGVAERFAYYIGVALYRDAVAALLELQEKPLVCVLAVEQNNPFDHEPYELAPYWIDDGAEEYPKLLSAIQTAQETGEWQNRKKKIRVLERPRWAKKLPLPGLVDRDPF